MVAEAPKEVTDFKFIAQRRVRLSDGDGASAEQRWANFPKWPQPKLLACSSAYGICVAAVTESTLRAFNTEQLHRLFPGRHDLQHEVPGVEGGKTVPVSDKAGCRIVHMASSCDGETLTVALVNADDTTSLQFYDYQAFSSQLSCAVTPFADYPIAPHGASLTCLEWNPAIANSLIFCTSDCSVSIWMVEGKVVKPTASKNIQQDGLATCASWSPKGKQVVLGTASGKIVQLKPDLSGVRALPCPDRRVLTLQGEVRCAGLCWLSTTEFAVLYGSSESQAVSLALLTAKKGAEPTWRVFDDICFGAVGGASPFAAAYHMMPIYQWNVLMCASSCACELAVLGKENDQEDWQAWTLGDDCRAELPMDKHDRDTYPIGVTVDYTSGVRVKLGRFDSDLQGVM